MMAVSRKYAGLPDLDAAPEIYETPELTEDGSTEQTSTLRTESPTPSEERQQDENVVRTRLNQEEARRRFEPTIVYAKDANLSDAIGGNRRGYQTAHRRRRRRYRAEEDGDVYDDLSDESGYEEETLPKRLARLRREAEEVRLELARREREEGEFKDTVEHQQSNNTQDDDRQLASGVEELNKVLEGLKMTSKSTPKETVEQEFRRRIEGEKSASRPGQKSDETKANGGEGLSTQSTSSVSAISAFSDRLTALETALGLPAITPSATPVAVLPTLDNLNAQITSLRNAIAPPQSSMTNSQKDHIDILSSRLHTLHVEADSLLNARKSALQALSQLQESRHRGNNSAVFARYLTRREARQRDSLDTAGVDDEAVGVGGEENNNRRPSSTNRREANAAKRPSHSHQQQQQDSATAIEDKIYTEVFLEEQSTKITALYNTLPTIQSLQPLLPVVLERLRGLSVIHASAATAANDMSDIETRLREWEGDIQKWRDAVAGVEKGIEDAKEIMKENLDVVGGLVKGVEERMTLLEKNKKGQNSK